jgi:hypothetical protein
VRIDISDVLAHEREADRALDMTLPIMRGEVALNLAIEKQGHPYRNRTTSLERSTLCYDSADPRRQPIEVFAEMGMYYASYVNDRGYSLIDDVMRNAADAIQRRLEEMAESIAE